MPATTTIDTAKLAAAIGYRPFDLTEDFNAYRREVLECAKRAISAACDTGQGQTTIACGTVTMPDEAAA